jgi:hypothetical protein
MPGDDAGLGRPSTRPPGGSVSSYEWAGLAGLGALLAYMLYISWRKWPDPLVDFGRELYIPWRLSHGAVLYRDVDDFYGPLSQYLNAGLFHLFGPGMMVLVFANLAVFLAIGALVYALVRREWGPPAALVSTAVFVAVFGFAQPIVASNFNFATPYAHEATHGVLVCLLLLMVLAGWVRQPGPWRSAGAGLLLGLAAVLKPEILLAAGVITCAAAALRCLRRQPIAWKAVVAWGVAALLPTFIFGLHFSRYFSWSKALGLASRGWLNALGSTKYVGDPVQIKALGFDQPWSNLWQHGLYVAAAMATVGLIAAAAALGERVKGAWARPASWVFVLAAGAWFAWSGVNWFQIGRCLLGLLLIYIGFAIVRLVRHRQAAASGDDRRLLAALLGASLMARMPLFGRVYQFGFYQAALAAVVVAAVLVGEFPSTLRIGSRARLLVATACCLIIGIGVGRSVWRSTLAFRNKTVEIGKERDRFYAFIPSIRPTGELVQSVVETLGQVAPGASLVVLPEGEMINYLARMPSPVAPFFFFSAATEGGAEAEIVRQLNARPPRYVVVISRDLREYGLHYYGETYGQGRAIMEWVEAHYQVMGTFGGSPIDPNQQGAVILSWGG